VKMTSSEELNLSFVPPGREEIARMIVNAFADAGFGKLQQASALANAIAESNLNPKAQSAPPDQCVGLFQLNRSGGLGSGHSVAELQDPATNITIIIEAAKKFADFSEAATLEDAVTAFVRKIERPANPTSEIAKRLKIAEKLFT